MNVLPGPMRERRPTSGRTAVLEVSLLILVLAIAAGCTPRPLAPVEDAAPPTIRVVEPQDGARVTTATPQIDIAYADAGSGPSVVSFRALVNGRDYSADFDHHSQGATGQISSARPLPLGQNHLEVEVADRAGNMSRASVTFFNASGGWLSVNLPPDARPPRSVELVLDASGSMQDAVGPSTRMDVAKDAVKSFVETLPARVPLGLRVFAGCDNIQTLVLIQPVDRAAFVARVQGIEPSGGTPIVASLMQSFDRLGQIQEGERLAVLATDGGESCGGSLAQAVDRGKDAGARVMVIGIDIRNENTRRAFRELAEATGGAFVNVQSRDPEALRLALERSVLRLGYEVFDEEGRRVAEGDVNTERVALPLGSYQVRLVMIPPVLVKNVRIGPLADTVVEFQRVGGSLAGHVRGPSPTPSTN